MLLSPSTRKPARFEVWHVVRIFVFLISSSISSRLVLNSQHPCFFVLFFYTVWLALVFDKSVLKQTVFFWRSGRCDVTKDVDRILLHAHRSTGSCQYSIKYSFLLVLSYFHGY